MIEFSIASWWDSITKHFKGLSPVRQQQVRQQHEVVTGWMQINKVTPQETAQLIATYDDKIPLTEVLQQITEQRESQQFADGAPLSQATITPEAMYTSAIQFNQLNADELRLQQVQAETETSQFDVQQIATEYLTLFQPGEHVTPIDFLTQKGLSIEQLRQLKDYLGQQNKLFPASQVPDRLTRQSTVIEPASAVAPVTEQELPVNQNDALPDGVEDDATQQQLEVSIGEIHVDPNRMPKEQILAEIDGIAYQYKQLLNTTTPKQALDYLFSIGLTPDLYGVFRKAYSQVLSNSQPTLVLDKKKIDEENAATNYQAVYLAEKKSGTREGGKRLLLEMCVEIRSHINNNQTDVLFDHPAGPRLSDFSRLYVVVRDYLDVVSDAQQTRKRTETSRNMTADELPSEVLEAIDLLQDMLNFTQSDVQHSQNNLIALHALPGEKSAFQIEASGELSETTYSSLGAASVFCTSNLEARKAGKYGQDCGGLAFFYNSDGHPIYSLCSADGVGGSAFGNIAAQEIVDLALRIGPLLSMVDRLEDVSLQPSVVENLMSAQDLLLIAKLKRLQPNLIDILNAETLSPLVKTAIEQSIEAGGSGSMFHNLEIDTETGIVEGTFYGDGGISVVRADGEVTNIVTGKSSNRVSTRHGVEHPEETHMLSDYFPNGLRLNPGDAIMIHSDGIMYMGATQPLAEIQTAVQQYQRGEITAADRDAQIATILNRSDYYQAGDDDRSLELFVMPYQLDQSVTMPHLQLQPTQSLQTLNAR